jgi:hypothetical protein
VSVANPSTQKTVSCLFVPFCGHVGFSSLPSRPSVIQLRPPEQRKEALQSPKTALSPSSANPGPIAGLPCATSANTPKKNATSLLTRHSYCYTLGIAIWMPIPNGPESAETPRSPRASPGREFLRRREAFGLRRIPPLSISSPHQFLIIHQP